MKITGAGDFPLKERSPRARHGPRRINPSARLFYFFLPRPCLNLEAPMEAESGPKGVYLGFSCLGFILFFIF